MSIKEKIEQLINESNKAKADDEDIDELDKKVLEACDDEDDENGKDTKEVESDDEDEDEKDTKPVVKESITLEEALSKKDFLTVAGIVHQVSNMKDRQHLAMLFASWFAGENAQFDVEKFHKACGTKVSDAYKEMDAAQKSNVKEDIDALLHGETLSEEFREKATTIFEAAVMTRVHAELVAIEEKAQVEQEIALRGLKEDLNDKINGYLDFVVEKWLQDNEIALESGIKNEIYENFIGKLKDVFVESYIEVPEEKFDLVDGLATEAAKARTDLNEAVEVAVAYKRELNDLKKEMLVKESTLDMTLSDAERFKELTEQLVYGDDTSFTAKLMTIKESYQFGNKTTKPSTKTFMTDTPVLIKEESDVSPEMQAILKYLK